MRQLRTLAALAFWLQVSVGGGLCYASDDPCAQIGPPLALSESDKAKARSVAYSQGLLWKIERDGSPPSHIFGTMHSQDRLVTLLPPPVRLTFAQSNSLVTEVVLDEAANQTFNESMYFTDGTILPSLLQNGVYERLSTEIAGYGVPPEDVERLKPWAAFTLLGRPRPVRAPTQDLVLLQMALTQHMPVYGLETMDELVAALQGLALEDQITILIDTICNHDIILKQTWDLVQLYVARDLAGMVAFNERPHSDEELFQRFMQRVLYDRNNRMAARMENYLMQGDAFIAVGAMHLPGEKGILHLLQEKGYRVTPVF
ncbi:MAG: TraB/GumN family protein [Gammaproteobacteria bacterium]|nr:TraB/GumN family protein [Gammaproteobacteria bacterium]